MSAQVRPITGTLERVRRRALAALAGLALSGLLAVAPTSAGAAEKGVVTDLTWGLSTADKNRSVAALTDLRARWVHMTLYWDEAEPTEGSYDPATFADLDEAIGLARAAGLRVFVGVSRSPAWARPAGSTRPVEPPTDPADLASFMRYAAARYAGEVVGWEVWNEPNHPFFWYSSEQDPADYVPLLKAAYPAIKSGDPGAKVLFAGIAFNDYQYMEGAYAALPDLGRYFDVLPVHPYSYNAPPEQVKRNADGRMTRDSFPAYREVRKTLADHGDGAKPIWLTEIGWAECEFPEVWCLDSEATVADYLTRAFRYIEQDPYVTVALWYNLRDSYWAPDANDWTNSLGLMRADFSQKPAYAAFRAYSPPPLTAPGGATGTTGGRSRTAVRLRVRRLRTARTRRAVRRFRASGRVSGASSGTVAVSFQRAGRRHRWRRASTRRVRISRSGRFVRRLRLKGAGRWRVRARYLGNSRHAPSKSRFVYVRVPRAR